MVNRSSLAKLISAACVFKDRAETGGYAGNLRFAASWDGRQGWRAMKAKMHSILAEDNQLSGNEQVRVEMQIFLHALNSYPERFARNPSISFEEYCGGLVQSAKTEPQGRD